MRKYRSVLLVPVLVCGAVFCRPAPAADVGSPNVPTALQGLLARSGGAGGGGGGSGGGTIDIESLQTLLSKERNITIRDQGDVLIVDGRVSSESSKVRLEKLTARYNNILNLTELIHDEDTIMARAMYLRDKIEERLNAAYDTTRAFVPPQRVEYDIVENAVVILGDLNNGADINRVSRIIDTYEKGGGQSTGMPPKEGGTGTSGQHLGVRQLPIEISVIFARMTHNDQYNLGTSGLTSAVIRIPEIQWSPEEQMNPITGESLPQTGTNSLRKVFRDNRWKSGEGSLIIGENGEIGVNMSDLFSSGAVLARPHLSALNGTEARFHSGGQVGIQTVSENVAEVEWKDYGTILTATPTLTTDGRIHLKIMLEFTVPEASGGTNYTFSRFEHSSEAIVSLNEGVILSGMIKEIRSRGRNGLPGLSKIPILGFFFGNRQRQVDNEELMVIVTPKVPKSVQCGPFYTSDDSARNYNNAMQEHRSLSGKERRRSWTNKWGIPETRPELVDVVTDTGVGMGQEIRVSEPVRPAEGDVPSQSKPQSMTPTQGYYTLDDERLLGDLVQIR